MGHPIVHKRLLFFHHHQRRLANKMRVMQLFFLLKLNTILVGQFAVQPPHEIFVILLLPIAGGRADYLGVVRGGWWWCNSYWVSTALHWSESRSASVLEDSKSSPSSVVIRVERRRRRAKVAFIAQIIHTHNVEELDSNFTVVLLGWLTFLTIMGRWWWWCARAI